MARPALPKGTTRIAFGRLIDRPEKTCLPSGTRLTPASAIHSGERPRPSKRISPEAGLIAPATASVVVDFPAPREEGQTLLVVEQSTRRALALADRLYLMR